MWTFAPFLAGVGTMQYRRFLFYNIVGGVLWTFVVVLAGYYFGTFSIVKENMSLLIFLVLLATLVTVIIIIAGLITAFRKKRSQTQQ